MNPGIEIGILWFDNDLIEVRVRASNGVFAGAADCYVARRGGLRELADGLRGFPDSADDGRTATLGSLEPGFAGGGARIRLRCVWSGGAPVAEVRLRRGDEPADEARIRVPVEAAGIDRLVAALDAMEPAVGDRAHIPMRR